MRAPSPVFRHPEYPEFCVALRTEEIRGIVIPRGFAWNGCSTPGVARPLLGGAYEGAQRDSAKLHDYLYATKLVSRKEADDLFYRQLIQDGASKAKARVMWTAVRLFAAAHYGKQEKFSCFIDEQTLAKWELSGMTVEQLPLFGRR